MDSVSTIGRRQAQNEHANMNLPALPNFGDTDSVSDSEVDSSPSRHHLGDSVNMLNGLDSTLDESVEMGLTKPARADSVTPSNRFHLRHHADKENSPSPVASSRASQASTVRPGPRSRSSSPSILAGQASPATARANGSPAPRNAHSNRFAPASRPRARSKLARYPDGHALTDVESQQSIESVSVSPAQPKEAGQPPQDLDTTVEDVESDNDGQQQALPTNMLNVSMRRKQLGRSATRKDMPPSPPDTVSSLDKDDFAQQSADETVLPGNDTPNRNLSWLASPSKASEGMTTFDDSRAADPATPGPRNGSDSAQLRKAYLLDTLKRTAVASTNRFKRVKGTPYARRHVSATADRTPKYNLSQFGASAADESDASASSSTSDDLTTYGRSIHPNLNNSLPLDDDEINTDGRKLLSYLQGMQTKLAAENHALLETVEEQREKINRLRHEATNAPTPKAKSNGAAQISELQRALELTTDELKTLRDAAFELIDESDELAAIDAETRVPAAELTRRMLERASLVDDRIEMLENQLQEQGQAHNDKMRQLHAELDDVMRTQEESIQQQSRDLAAERSDFSKERDAHAGELDQLRRLVAEQAKEHDALARQLSVAEVAATQAQTKCEAIERQLRSRPVHSPTAADDKSLHEQLRAAQNRVLSLEQETGQHKIRPLQTATDSADSLETIRKLTTECERLRKDNRDMQTRFTETLKSKDIETKAVHVNLLRAMRQSSPSSTPGKSISNISSATTGTSPELFKGAIKDRGSTSKCLEGKTFPEVAEHVQQLDKQLNDANMEIKRLTEQLAEAAYDNVSLAAQLKTLRLDSTMLSRELQEALGPHEWQERQRSAGNVTNTYLDQLVDKVRHLTQAEERNASVEKELDLAKQLVYKLKMHFGASKSDARDLLEEYGSIAETVTAQRDTIRALEKQIDVVDTTTASKLASERITAISVINRLLTRQESITDDFTRLGASVWDVDVRLAAQVEEIDRLKAVLKRKDSELRKAGREQRHLHRSKAEMFKSIDSLREELKAVQEDAVVLGRDIDLALREPATGLQLSASEAQKSLRQQLSEAEQRITELAQLASQPSSDDTNELIARHREECRGLFQWIAYLKKRCLREGQFRDDLRLQKEYLQTQLEREQVKIDTTSLTLQRFGLPLLASNEPEERVPRLKSVAVLVLSTIRLQRMAADWRSVEETKKLVRSAYAHVRGKSFQAE
ncbi:hypothetical protein E5Q_02703 [Mixia osmundae IAM 14324]|uniref:Pericentrin/AKAP-450 centrosomal targeting domain-containing protein n=1 Tax=Mixia osmundae (strain CBS 9802 / IAM 14324 / JCM 22182 / KY 12970) TaxID=764103 RepID=G7DZN2_MIXOS|nr:hypothetical protein E5Q_02703 [Mixia osmundae IAM 14324]